MTSNVAAIVDSVYRRYHRPEFISPDPLDLVLEFAESRDREIAAFIASSFALGRVDGIRRATRWVLSRLGEPGRLSDLGVREIESLCEPFRYRFFGGDHLAGLLIALKRVITEHGTLENCLVSGMHTASGDTPLVVSGLITLTDRIHHHAEGRLAESILVARPQLGSACKRLLLFLRWMVRCDRIDPGGWTRVHPADLLVPVDTHMLRVCRWLGLTPSRTASLAVSRELTQCFAAICPADPVRYDFSLTRLGIHPEARLSETRRKIESGSFSEADGDQVQPGKMQFPA